MPSFHKTQHPLNWLKTAFTDVAIITVFIPPYSLRAYTKPCKRRNIGKKGTIIVQPYSLVKCSIFENTKLYTDDVVADRGLILFSKLIASSQGRLCLQCRLKVNTLQRTTSDVNITMNSGETFDFSWIIGYNVSKLHFLQLPLLSRTDSLSIFVHGLTTDATVPIKSLLIIIIKQYGIIIL